MDDSEIIDLFFQRSEKAIFELSGKYEKVFFKISMNILNSRQDAEECVNDSYLGAWNAIPPKRPNPLLSYPAAWYATFPSTVTNIIMRRNEKVLMMCVLMNWKIV